MIIINLIIYIFIITTIKNPQRTLRQFLFFFNSNFIKKIIIIIIILDKLFKIMTNEIII